MKKGIARKRKTRKPRAGEFVVVRALNRSGLAFGDAIDLAKRRVASRRQGHSHTLLVMRTAAVVKLQQVMAVTVERVPHP